MKEVKFRPDGTFAIDGVLNIGNYFVFLDVLGEAKSILVVLRQSSVRKK